MKNLSTILFVTLVIIIGLHGCNRSGDNGSDIPDNYSQGEYMGQKWYIDENHMIWWDDKPYIRYSFTGSPSIDQLDEFVAMGIDQFGACPSEEAYVFGNDPKEQQQNRNEVDAFTTKLTELGGTYYACLNTLLPWKATGKITEESRVPFMERGFMDVTEYSGTSAPVTVEIYAQDDFSDYTDEENIEVHLFDFDAEARTDLSDKIVSVEWKETGEEDADYSIVIELDTVDFPSSSKLAIAASVPTTHETVFAYDLPAMWKQDVQDYFKASLEFFRDAYRKEGLRGMLFSDEIALWDASPFSWQTEDFNRDDFALDAYHGWLEEIYNQNIAALNDEFGHSFASFDEVPWYTYSLPYESMEHLNEYGKLFGLYSSSDAVENVFRRQNDFRFDFYGSWYAKYADIARSVIGNVPVFTTIWSTQNSNGHEHDIHRQAMMHGTDGLVRNSYGTVNFCEELGYNTINCQDLKGIEDYLEQTVQEAGKTKAYYANEFYWVKGNDDDNAEPFQFPSKDDMRDFLKVMIEYGYTGFHLFIMNPGEIWEYAGDKEDILSQKQDMKWFIELKDEIIYYALER